MHSLLTEADEGCHTSAWTDHDEWLISCRHDEVTLSEEHPHSWLFLSFALEVLHVSGPDEL